VQIIVCITETAKQEVDDSLILTLEDVPQGVVDGGEDLLVRQNAGWPSLHEQQIQSAQDLLIDRKHGGPERKLPG
jgi:hypothetical protein